MAVKLVNNARSTLATAITATETVVRVRVGHGIKFPVLSVSGDWYPLALEDDSGNIEYLRCTARSGDSMTVERGAEGTQARSYSAGDVCQLRLTAGALEAATNPDPHPGVLPAASISDAAIVGPK